MRKDIAETLREFLMNGIKPNYSKIAKQFNCDARTVKRYFLNCQNLKRKPRVVVKVLDAYEELVIGDFYKLKILQKKERVSYVKIVSLKPNS